MPQPQFAAASLAGCLDRLLTSPDWLKAASAGARLRARADAAACLADVVEARMSLDLARAGEST
jgi:UDP-N-acetylglucosamine:LPS N-acetylglucosamine transferase